MKSAHNFTIYKGVRMGKHSQIGQYCVIGVPYGELPTVIGHNSIIRSHSVIYAGNNIGDNFQTGHGVLIREENRIGNNVSIGSHSVVEHHVTIGNNVRIHSGSFIPEYSILEDNIWIGPHVTLTNAKYPASKQAKKYLKGPTIKKGAKIGAGAVILPGVTIGKNALVGAGSVVITDISDSKVAVGNPAKAINDVKNLKYKSGEYAYDG